MNPAQILIVDDEANIRYILEQALSGEGYQIDTAADATTALEMVATTSYDLLLLDLHLESMSGLDVLDSAREQDPDLVAIILTAHRSVESAVDALRLGAFDYLFKPAPLDIVRQRVKEGLQHRQQALCYRQVMAHVDQLRQALNALAPPTHSHPQHFMQSDKLMIDRRQRLATLDGSILDLTTTEFDILACMVEVAPEPLSPRQLVERALGYKSDDLEARDIAKWHIHHLRRKIESDPAHPHYIQTVRHKGYMWRGEQVILLPVN